MHLTPAPQFFAALQIQNIIKIGQVNLFFTHNWMFFVIFAAGNSVTNFYLRILWTMAIFISKGSS